ncbi:permease-like cell division protein FtsX [Myxococcota bacterium]|nr:permease-like cell division protein FtsX [Myxococcota bacterium]
MKTWAYYFQLAIHELKRRPLAHVFTVFTVALAFLLAGLVIWVAESVKVAEHAWSAGQRMTVVLEAGLAEADRDRLVTEISGFPGVREVTKVSPEQARSELIAALGPDSNLIVDVEPGFFPAVLDVVISGDPQTVRSSQHRLRSMAGVHRGVGDVRSMDRWNLRFGNVFEIAALIAALLCGVVLLVSGWVIMSAARSRVETQVDELVVLRSLGASPAFMRTPLVLVSLFHGFVGGLLALGLLAGVFWLGAPLLEVLLGPGASDFRSFVLFTARGAGIALAATALTGMLAARVALLTVRVQG